MKISDFYKMCISLQPKTTIRVYDGGKCIYNGDWGDMPHTIACHDFEHVSVNPEMNWKFYFNTF